MSKPLGGMRIHIKTSPGKPFTIVVRTQDPTIDDVKAEIEERMGISVNEQRLIFSGKVLEPGWREIEKCGKVVDIAAVESHKAALSKDKETGNQTEVGSKRARGDSSSASHYEGLLSCGAMRVHGMESFWDEEDFGLAWRKSRSVISPYDTNRFESKTPQMLIESVANDSVRTLNAMAFLERQLQEYQDKLSLAKSKVKHLSERNAYVEDSLQKEKKCVKKVMQDMNVECSTGTSFLQSEDGRRLIVSSERQAAKSGVEDFKKSPAFKELVMDRAVGVYNDAVTRCQRLLRESGRVSEDIIKLIGPQD